MNKNNFIVEYGWQIIKCKDCETTEKLEFSTSDGAESKSEICCLSCNSGDKKICTW